MYDAIVVGARCAGSSAALLLARKGYKVLLVDRSVFPSDLPFSTHYIHQSGIARLKRWGILDKVVRSGCPPITRFHFDFRTFFIVWYSGAKGKDTRARRVEKMKQMLASGKVIS